MRPYVALLAAAAMAAGIWLVASPTDERAREGGGDGPPAARTIPQPSGARLPPEALDVLQRIQRGGGFRHRQDGSVFRNREGLLPRRPRGYYREYTVPTPGSPDRGARRIVVGGDPPQEAYYTPDHYQSFRKLDADLGP